MKIQNRVISWVLALCLCLSLCPMVPAYAASSQPVALYLDGKELAADVQPEIRDGRTMIPIRMLAEALGANVGWEQATRKVTLTRAGVTVEMTVGSKTAYVDGKAMEMDVAPYIVNERTLIPARYVAEFFGQTVTWDGEERRVYVEEDKSVVGDSNMEAWALPMGAMLSFMNRGDARSFGMWDRGGTLVVSFTGATSGTVSKARSQLSGSYGVKNRDDLIITVLSMTLYGHDETFRGMAADVKLRTPEERAAISAQTPGTWPAYMWEQTEQIDEKWGDRGILCWDLFRMSDLVQWGYIGGYLTYAEALALLEPAARLLCENFSSWEEAYENYLDGYNWWARNDMTGRDIWETARGQNYQMLLKDKDTGPIFDDALFQTGVVSVPGVTARQLLEEAQRNSK